MLQNSSLILETNLRLPKAHHSVFGFLVPKTVIWICGSFKRNLLPRPPPHPVPGSGSTRRAMCFPLLPASLARTGSRSRPQHRLPLGKCRSGSRLPPKGKATSRVESLLRPPGPWRIQGSHWLCVSRGPDAIGRHFQPEGGTRLGCMAQEAGGAGRAGAERRVAHSGVGCFGLAFFFFLSAKEVCFGHASRRPPPPAPSPAPPCTPLGADCRAPSVERAAEFARASLAHLVEGAS